MRYFPLLVLISMVIGVYTLLHPTIINRSAASIVISILFGSISFTINQHYDSPLGGWEGVVWGFFWLVVVFVFFSIDYSRFLKVKPERGGPIGIKKAYNMSLDKLTKTAFGG
jgi:Ca2+/Na+ antiporter